MPKQRTGKKKGKRTIAGRKIAGKEGAAVQYLTRNQAIKKLQVSLPDFRRLCILKGVYPREPKKKVHGKDKTYYYTKDILFLSHESILSSFRDLKAFLKKFKKAEAKDDVVRVEKLKEQKPSYDLSHIVRERYPSFIDALRDIDDALCLITLFSTLASDDNLIATRVQNCERLHKELMTFIIRKRCLKKMFLSIKGIYYQAEIMGQKITWIAPYKFKQSVPGDVDMRVMLTFLEFYEVLLHFTNYRLFHAEGLAYPPATTRVWENSSQPLEASTVEDRDEDGEDEGEGAVPETFEEGKPLLSDCVVWLSREVPVESLLFVIQSFGGRVAFEGDASGLTVDSAEITHHIVDRKKEADKKEGREYVQPQWVYDSCNTGLLLPTFEYAPGASLPSHLSPFVDDDAEGYIPKRKEYLQRVKGEAMAEEEGEEDDDDEDDDDEEEEEEEGAGEAGEGEEGEDEDEDEDEISGDEKEAPVKKTIQKKKSKAQKAEEDQKALASGLMSRKTRKMYTNIKRAETKKAGNVDELKRKRAEAEAKDTGKPSRKRTKK